MRTSVCTRYQHIHVHMYEVPAYTGYICSTRILYFVICHVLRSVVLLKSFVSVRVILFSRAIERYIKWLQTNANYVYFWVSGRNICPISRYHDPSLKTLAQSIQSHYNYRIFSLLLNDVRRFSECRLNFKFVHKLLQQG